MTDQIRTTTGSSATSPPGPPRVQLTPTPLHGPWPAVSIWGARWLGPGRPASATTVAALSLAAVVAAVSIPLDRPGLGWLITALAGAAALMAARRVPPRLPAGLPPAIRPVRFGTLGPARYGWSAATVLLLGVGTVRAAGWLFVLCLLTALLTGVLAVTDSRSLRAMVVAGLMAPAAVVRAVPWFARGVGAVSRRAPGRANGARMAATVLASVGLLIVFGALFASADAAFADLIARALPRIDEAIAARWIFVGVIALGLLAGAAFLRAAPPILSGMDGLGRRRLARLEWAIPLGLLVLLFATFVAVQLTVLFGGSRLVLETDGLTYAQYARGGFWQLLVVTVLTLLVLAGAARWAPRTTGPDRTLIRVILGALAALTLVIVSSALHRMNLYADTYGLTRLRVLVWLCELWLGVVFGLILLAGVRLRGGWLPRVAVAAGVLALLGLAVANPDGLIAKHNVTRAKLDTAYLASLSADAASGLDRLDPQRRACILAAITGRVDPDDWRGWNYGRERARRALANAPTCTG